MHEGITFRTCIAFLAETSTVTLQGNFPFKDGEHLQGNVYLLFIT